jgi:hypothetical protein
MPEANTMETAKTELVESFIKYITGVYLLQQEFIDDMQGGLQSVLEKYNVTSVNDQLDNVQETVAVAVAPKKTRKKSTKKEVVEEQVETVERAEPVEDLQDVQDAQDAQDLQDLQDIEPSEETVQATIMEEQVSIPSHVSSVLNTEEKKTRKPRAKKNETGEETIKKKRATNPYRVFITEYSKNPELKGLKVAEKTQLASPIWEKIKEDPERLKEYEEKADAINKENGL